MNRDPFASLREAVDELAARSRAVPAGDDVAAYEFVTDLSEALRRLPELLEPVPALADAAALGRAREQELERWLTELRARDTQIAERLAALEKLRPVIDDLRWRAERREQLDVELTELRRLAGLAAELEAVQRQHALMERRKAELSQVAEHERRLGRAAEELREVSANELSHLRDDIARAVADVARAERDVAAARAKAHTEQAELARLTGEMETLGAESRRRMPSLRLYRQAERALIDGLAEGSAAAVSGVHHARETMDDIEERLRALDDSLKAAMEIHDDAYERARKAVPLTREG